MAALLATVFGSAVAVAQAKKDPQQDVLKKRMQQSAQLFLENKGQWDSQVKFLARANGINVWVKDSGLVLDYFEDTSSTRRGHAIGMDFVGSGAQSKAVGVKRDRLVTDFFHSKADRTARQARSYKEARIDSLYEGVDLRSYMENGLPRYDLIVAAGTDPDTIRAQFTGATKVKLDMSGNLVLGTSLGERKHTGLRAYQVSGGKQVPVKVAYRLVGKNQVAFDLGAYDSKKELVIDPLVYGSYYGGDSGFDEVLSLVADTDGGVYYTGYTHAPDFPAIFGPYGFNLQGARDGFISKLQGDAYAHDYAAIFGGSLSDEGQYLGIDPHKNIWIAGKTQSCDFPTNTRSNIQYLQNAFVGVPPSGTFRLQYDGNWTAPIAWNANAATVQAALEALPGLAGLVTVSGGPLQGVEFRIEFDNSRPLQLNVDNNSLVNRFYQIYKPHDIFVLRFAKDPVTVLNPLPTTTRIMGGERDEPLGGIAIVPNDNPGQNDPVKFAIVGSNQPVWQDLVPYAKNVAMPEILGMPKAESDGYVIRMTYDAGVITTDLAAYMSNPAPTGIPTSCSGVVMIPDGSMYISGTAYASTNVDTAVDPIFETTPGVFFEGRLLRFTDGYIRKFGPANNLVFSALLGGNGNDECTGLAVDTSFNVYLTGVARSFNFPRTRGVYGENFPASRVVFATKLNQDSSQITYSTHMNTSGWVTPNGIAVDNQGVAYIGGTVEYNLNFPPLSALPDAIIPGTIPTTPDALKGTNTQTSPPQMGTTDGFLLALTSSANNLLYGTYIGGDSDDTGNAPYVDRRGDVWMVGMTSSFRFYAIGLNFFFVAGQLPGNHLSPFAFKRFPDASGGSVISGVLYGLREPDPGPPQRISVLYGADGYLLKLRQSLPTITNITVNPSAIAGGLGASSAGTVTLSGGAPSGGLDIELTLNSTSASFDPNTAVQSMIVTVPQGVATATFTVYSNVVTGPTQVQVKASIEGNFMIAQMTIEPWLSELTISPTTLVGGNTAIGRVRLFQTATQDITVNLTSEDDTLVVVPTTVVVPTGQDTVAFNIETHGVAVNTPRSVTASLLGVGRTQVMTLTPASLLSVTFNPTRVTGGTSSTGTVKLNGEAGGTFTVDLTMDGGLPPGYAINPSQLTFNQGDRELTFTVDTAWEPVNTQRVIRATRTAQGPWSFQTITGTLFVDNSNLVSFTINPDTVDIGQDSTGTVSLSVAAGQGGAVVNLSSSNPTLASVPAQVIVPSGATSASFTITVTDDALTADGSAIITASRGPTSIDQTLTVRKTTLDLTVNPSSVVGGQGSTGTVTIGAQAPSGGLVVNLSSNVPEAQVQAQVTIPQGATSANFPITTSTVGSVVNATITATAGTLSDSANLQIKPIGLVSIKFSPATVRGGQTTQCRVEIDAAAPSGGATVALAAGINSHIVILPPSVTIPQNQTFLVFTVQSRRVSRTLTTVVTATYNGSQANGSLTVRK